MPLPLQQKPHGSEQQQQLPPHNPGPPPALVQLLTIKDVAALLGVDKSTVHRRIKEGRFHPIKDKKRGCKLLFHPNQVDEEIARIEQIRRGSPGEVFSAPRVGRKPKAPPEIMAELRVAADVANKLPDVGKPKVPDSQDGAKCAKAVKLFREGHSQLDVVVEMEVDFEVAEYYWKRFLIAQPGWFLASKQFARLRDLLEWNEEVPTPEGFMKAVQEFINKQINSGLKATPEELGEGVGAGSELALTDEERQQLEAMGDGETPDDD